MVCHAGVVHTLRRKNSKACRKVDGTSLVCAVTSVVSGIGNFVSISSTRLSGTERIHLGWANTYLKKHSDTVEQSNIRKCVSPNWSVPNMFPHLLLRLVLPSQSPYGFHFLFHIPLIVTRISWTNPNTSRHHNTYTNFLCWQCFHLVVRAYLRR